MTTTRQAGPVAAPSVLEDALAQVVRRLRLARWVRLASRGAFVAVCLALLCVGLAHWNLLPSWLPQGLTVPVLLILGVGIGTLLAGTRPIDSFAAAREVEMRLGLKERLSSALEFERSGQTTSDPEAALLLRLQQEDASAHARALRPADAVPLRFSWEMKALIPALFLLLFALALPAFSVFVPPGVRAERAVVQKSGEELARNARVVEKSAGVQGLPATKSAAHDLQKLGHQMAQGHMDKKQALVQMARLSNQLADEQRRLAQASGGPGQSDKDLTQAGRQLAQSLNQPSSTSGQANGKNGAASSAKMPSQGAVQTSPGTGSPEMHGAAQALHQNDAFALSKQLRALAQRASAHPASIPEKQQTAQDLQKLSAALKGTSLAEAQKHIQAAGDSMKRGDAQRASEELRHAADAADYQAKQQQDAQGVQEARQALQDSKERMAQQGVPPESGRSASGHGDAGEKSQASAPNGSGAQGQRPSGQIPQTSGQKTGGGRSTASGSQSGPQAGMAGRTAGNGSSVTPGLSRPNQSSAGDGRGDATARTGALHGAPHPLDAKFNPTQNPKYGKIYLGAGSGQDGGGKVQDASPGVQTPPRASAGSVPYYDTLAPARKSAETAMDREDIPPAYRSSVRQYFDALQPPAARPMK